MVARGGPRFRELVRLFHAYDYPFPVAEAFLSIVIATTVLSVFAFGSAAQGPAGLVAANMAGVSAYIPSLFFGLLGLRNVSYGVGGWREAGDWRLYLQFPVSRSSLLSARLVSAVGLPLVLLVVGCTIGLVVAIPSVVLFEFPMVLAGLLATLLPILLVIAGAVPLSLAIRNPSTTFFAGIFLLVGFESTSQLVIANSSGSDPSGPLLAIFAPAQDLSSYLGANCVPCLPSFEAVISAEVATALGFLVLAARLFRNRVEV